MSVLELPSPHQEEWRWTDMAALRAAAQAPARATDIDPTAYLLDRAGPKLIFVDGELDPRSEPGGVGFMRLSFDTEHPLGSRTRGQVGLIRALGRDDSVATIQILHVGSGGERHLPMSLALDEDVPASLVETFVGSGWSNQMTRLKLARGARLMRSVRLLQDEGFVSIRDEVEVGEAASYISVFLGAGGMGSRIDGGLTLTGKGAFAEMGGALLTRGAQKQEAAVAVRHQAVEGTSHQLWRAVAADRSVASLAARVEVARDAQKTDGQQSLRGLLLDRGATVNLKPELEIFADDVKCAHGATVGELDRKALFYLQSRGVPEGRAKALLTHAFVAESLARIGDEPVRAAFETDAAKWLDAAL